MAEPSEQAAAWVRALAPPVEELAAVRVEALEEIAKWQRGEPSRMTLGGVDALDAADAIADPPRCRATATC